MLYKQHFRIKIAEIYINIIVVKDCIYLWVRGLMVINVELRGRGSIPRFQITDADLGQVS